MNSTNLSKIYIACICFSVGALTCNSEPAPTNAPARLTGSILKLEDAVSKADAVFAGIVEDEGGGSYKSLGEITYYHVKVRTSQVFCGTVGGLVFVSARVGYAKKENEEDLKKGGSYIFIVKKNSQQTPDPFVALKIIPATDDNITKVKALIAALPVGK